MSESARFRAMLRDDLAPRMRAVGFVGSGHRYVLPDDFDWCVVALQRHAISTYGIPWPRREVRHRSEL